MGRQSRTKKSENLGKGKVTPVQIAFIVDRYLCDNHFNQTRFRFRSEASSLIAKSPVREAPKTLLTLDAILNEYISLKEQKVAVDQERTSLENEKIRVHNLLQGMQSVMTAYNATASVPSPAIQANASGAPESTAVVLQPNTFRSSSPDYPVYNTSNVMPASLPGNKRVGCGNFMPPSTSRSQNRKRKSSDVSLGTSEAVRRSHQKIATQSLTTKGPGFENLAEVGSSAYPKTPQDMPLHKDTAISLQQEVTPRQTTPTSRTVVSKERITVSPLKDSACYTISRSHCLSSSPVNNNLKRDHVKGRLNFDTSDVPPRSDKPSPADGNLSCTSESDKEIDLFDIDFSKIDTLAGNFSFSEILTDLDLDCEGIGYPCQPLASNDLMEESSPESWNCTVEAENLFSEYSSTMGELVSGKDSKTEGPNAMTTMKSITKCVTILSPAKNRRQRMDTQTTD